MSLAQKKISYKFSITNLVLVNQVYPFDFFLRIRVVKTQQFQDSPIIEANKMQCDEVFPWEFAMNEVLLRVQFVQITKNTRIQVLRAHFNVNEITDQDGQTVAMLASRSSKKLCIVTYKLQPYTQLRITNKQKPKQKTKNNQEEEDEGQEEKNDTSPSPSPQKDKKNTVLFSKQQHDQLSKQIAQINKSIDKILQNQKNQHALFNKYLDQSTSFIKEVMNNSRANRYNESDNENDGEDGKNNKGNTQNILKEIQQQSQPQLDSINNSDIIKPNQNPNQIKNQKEIQQNQQQFKPQKAEIKQSTSAKWYKFKYNKLRSQKIAKNINYRKQNFSNSQASLASQPQPSEFSLQYSQNNNSPSPSSSSLILFDLSVNSCVKPYQIKISQLLLEDIKDNQNSQNIVKGDETQPKTMKKQNKQKKENLLLTIKSKSGPCYDWKKAFQLPNKKCYIIGIVGNVNETKDKQKQIQIVGCIGSKQLQRGKVPLFDNKGQQKGYIRFNHKLLNAYSVQTHQLLELPKLQENQDKQQNKKQQKNQKNQENNSGNKKEMKVQKGDQKIDEQGQQQEQEQDEEQKQQQQQEEEEEEDENKQNQIKQKSKEKEKEKLKEKQKEKLKQKEKQKQKQKEQRYQLKRILSKDTKNSARTRRLSIDKGKKKEGQKKVDKQQLQNKQQALQSQQQGQKQRLSQKFKQIQKERSKQKFKQYKVIYEEKDKDKEKQNQKNNQKLNKEEKEKQPEQEQQKTTQKQDDKKNKKYNIVSNSISVSLLPMKKHTISEQSVYRRTPFLSEEQISSINSSQFISKIKTINLKIDSVSAKLSKNPNQFAGKFVKLSIRNKNPYMTETINLSQNLIWQCKGCIFDSVSPYAQMLVQLCSDENNRPKTIGKAKICLALLNMQKQNRVQFYHEFLKDQNDNQIGELIIGYDNIEKTRRVQSGKKSVNNSVQHHSNLDDGLEEQNDHNLSAIQDASQRKRKAKTKTKSKSKSKKKPEGSENTNRTEKRSSTNNIGMDGSQAKLIGSTSAIRSKKYTGGNIIIGRAPRFRHGGIEQKPGPGKYEMPSTFQRHANT